MLRYLSLRDFVIVDRLELEFKAGFTVLTGETGAGKSILVDALALVLGSRSDAPVLRPGATKAELSADFDIAGLPAAGLWLAERELADEGACLLRRVIDEGNRSRAFINGRSATLTQLRELGGLLLDIHGQHEHQRLLDREAQLAVLDAYSETELLLDETARAWKAWRLAADARAAREADDAQSAREREELSWQIEELRSLNFSNASWETLQADHARLANAASLIETASGALDRIEEAEGSIAGQVEAVAASLRRAAETDIALKPPLELVESAGVHLAEAAHQFRQYLSRLEVDPARLAEVDAQLAAVHSVARKHRIDASRLGELLADKEARFEALGGQSSIEALQMREAELEREYSQVAGKLTARRVEGAKRFGTEVTRTMQTLAMEGGRFHAQLVAGPPSAHGNEHCEFAVAAHPGQVAGPLSRIASGGELSRISLAIQMLASTRAGVPTLIFDEVDAGIGGRVAEIVGRLLKELAGNHQVLCVTHLAQVAACAEQQYRVSKEATGKAVASRIEVLSGPSRVEEIARMLGGIQITAATRKHAEEMLSNAGAPLAGATGNGRKPRVLVQADEHASKRAG